MVGGDMICFNGNDENSRPTSCQIGALRSIFSPGPSRIPEYRYPTLADPNNEGVAWFILAFMDEHTNVAPLHQLAT